jgi:hypothetical protein
MRDIRRYSRQTNVRLGIGFVLILFIIGDGLIYLIYGQKAAIMGVICLSFGLAPLTLILLILIGIDRLVRRINQRDG